MLSVYHEEAIILDYVILGFLLMRNVTQYDIKRALEQKVSPFFSASLGSIQAALKKLESKRLVQVNDTVEKGRRKKIYSITDEGRTYFSHWMLTPVSASRMESQAMTKMFFLGLVSPADRLVICRQIIMELEDTVREYTTVQTESGKTVFPEKTKDIAAFQLRTLDLGILQHEQTLAWLRKMESDIEKDMEKDMKKNMIKDMKKDIQNDINKEIEVEVHE
jgi:DNA-binding PadR family transcriptional regulator